MLRQLLSSDRTLVGAPVSRVHVVCVCPASVADIIQDQRVSNLAPQTFNFRPGSVGRRA
jgi:hypothetical protein